MATVSVDQLVTVPTKDQQLQTVIDLLDSLGFSTTSWQDGSVDRTKLEVFAQCYVTLATIIRDLARSGFNADAVGDWLTLFSASQYDNTRAVARSTKGTVVLTASASAPGPFTIDTGANQKIVADTVNGYIYRNTTGGTLNAGSTLEVTVQADVAAANRDVANDTITILKTPMAGVTVSNPAISGTSTWITQFGADPESDDELKFRNQTKWGTLAPDGPESAYLNWAVTADAAVTRVTVNDLNPRGPGTANLYLAGANGAVGASVVAAVDDYIQGVTDGKRRRGLNVDLETSSAANLTVVITGTVFILAQYNTTELQDAIKLAIDTFFKAIPIGGTKTSSTGPGYVILSGLANAIFQAGTGVFNAKISSPTDDVELAATQVAVPSYAGTLVFQDIR